ncbi:MAG: ferrous iron transport protein B [Lachnospira sp.]|nr:ferrous iron transport protein B [Lachnospira sp.]
MTIKDLPAGKSATILKVGGDGALRQHFLDMGLIQGAEVTVIKYAPMGDPVELRIHSYELTIRLSDAEQIEVSEPYCIDNKAVENVKMNSIVKEHPGFGEGGRYHDKENENPLPDDEKLTFALVGNQNCGKTTLFNVLTGSNQHIGNFPGVTVDRKDGVIKGYPDTLITDLPGIYSMSPYSSEEIVTREFLLMDKPKGIINILDATNIERNLYLSMQLMELGIPMVIALNMMDEVRVNGGSVRINAIEELLGVPVIPISAAKGEGIEELVSHAIHVAKYQEKPQISDFCSKDSAVHRCIHGIMSLISDHADKAGYPERFAASKVVEGDSLVLKHLELEQNEKEMIEHIIVQMEEECGMDRASAIADMRFAYIEDVCKNTVVKPRESKERIRSQKIDKLLTGKYTGIPMFIAIMGLVFYLTFNVIGAALSNVLDILITFVTNGVDNLLTAMNVNSVLHALIIDGIFNGVGSVLSFLPIIVTLFFFLSILEDSGYMARVAFIMDKLLRKLGLSGRSIVPMLIGFGCSVPGVMASRTLSSERDRRMTVLLTPFMSCSAKVPIYAFFSAAFFPHYAALVMIGMYFIGIIVGIIMAFIFKKTLFKGEPVPFVMELPNYRMPGAKNVVHLLWEKAKDFLQKAFSIIFIATILIWFMQNFDIRLNVVADSRQSILAVLAGMITPLFKPLGFVDWRLVTAILTGVMAKESVVSTISILFGSTIEMVSVISAAGAMSFLVFCLLYTPCVAAIASVKKELGGKWAAYVVVIQCVVAWIAALITYIIAGIL